MLRRWKSKVSSVMPRLGGGVSATPSRTSVEPWISDFTTAARLRVVGFWDLISGKTRRVKPISSTKVSWFAKNLVPRPDHLVATQSFFYGRTYL